MKHITTTLMLIVGFQFTICAEIIYYEKMFQEIRSEPTTDNNKWIEYYPAKEVETFELGTIRLESGETLTTHSQKLVYENLSNLGRWHNISQASFTITVNYDNFTSDETIQIKYNGSKWEVSRIYGKLTYDDSVWPIEGPATINVKIDPLDIQNDTNSNKWHVRPKQFLRVAFKKSLTEFNTTADKIQTLVLPKGVQGMSVIMESSEDLVNWTTDSLGPKNAADGHRFFRLRAVKE